MGRVKTSQGLLASTLQCEARRRFLLCGVAAASAARLQPARAATRSLNEARAPTVEVDRQGGVVFVRAQADADATLPQAYATLVDYDRLADFIPDIAASRTLSRSGSSAVVEQRGHAGFGPFGQTYTLVLAVQEEPNVAIRASLAGGDFKRFDASYRLVSLATHSTRIEYRAVLEPTNAVPRVVGMAILRDLIRRQFAAMIGEIGRRGAAG
jgi:ribosome-associated toxin RatA of RatAB toxin-antitoxin module